MTAQHTVYEITRLLREKGVNVRSGIHPVAGMQVWKAKTSIVMKRSMASGYAGVDKRPLWPSLWLLTLIPTKLRPCCSGCDARSTMYS